VQSTAARHNLTGICREKPIYSDLAHASGRALRGDQGYGSIPPPSLERPRESKDVHKSRRRVAVVVGGGNIFRGLALFGKGLDRASPDYLGMHRDCAQRDSRRKTRLRIRTRSLE